VSIIEHTASFPQASRQVSLALVHHANKYLMTEGYEDSEGMSDILGLGRARAESDTRGLLPALQMHLGYRVPLNLHLSGTLIESIACHYPECFSLIKTTNDQHGLSAFRDTSETALWLTHDPL
jgi:hypothetical protein